MSKAGIFTPASQPIFDGQVVRNPTRVEQPPGGVGDYPFQFSWPGLINYFGESPRIPDLSGGVINEMRVTFQTLGSGSLSIQIRYDGVTQQTIPVSGSGAFAVTAGAYGAGSVISVNVSAIGSGSYAGMWIGLRNANI